MLNNNVVGEETDTLNENKKLNDFKYDEYIFEYIEKRINGNLGYFKNQINVVDDFFLYLRLEGKENIVNQFREKFKDRQEIKTLLQNQINLKVLPIYDLIDRLIENYFSDLDLNEEQKNKLLKLLYSENESNLYGLLKSEKQRHSYLLRNGILTKEELEQKLDGISKKDRQVLEKIFSVDNQIIEDLIQNTDLVRAIFSVCNKNSLVHYSDIKEILESDIFKNRKNEKIALIKYFLPTISLKFALESGIISDFDCNTKLLEIVNKNNLVGNEKDFFVQKVDKSLIFISTSGLDLGNIDFDEKGDDIFKSIANEINNTKINEIDILGIEEFNTACVRSKLLVDLNKFKEGNYLKIVSKDDNGKENSFYFYINNISLVGVELINITRLNGISASNKGKKYFHTYDELFKLIESIQNSQSKQIYICEKADLKVGDKQIDEIPEKEDINTLDGVKKMLDELDPENSGIELKNMAFSFKKGEGGSFIFDENFFFVTKIDEINNSITINNGQTFAGYELSIFVKAFEENKCTRFKKIDDAGEFLAVMGTINDEFKDLVYDNKKIVPKDKKGHHDYPGINMFIGKDQTKDGAIRIDKIEDGKISFSFGEYIEGNESKNEQNIFKIKNSGNNWSYTSFFMFIKNRKLKPKQKKVEEHHHEESHGEHMHRHRNLITEYMNLLSILEITKGIYQLIHTIEHRLETGTKIQTARAALMFGKFLPYHLRVELQSEVENSEKETMEKVKQELLGVDSSKMIPMVIHILENKSSHQYEIEAAMFAILKYGTLYPKDLLKYRGSYVWFYALGGTKELIEKITKDSLENNPTLVVTEEVLIKGLLTMQSKGYIPPKRRSKIYKEFSKTIEEGLSEESSDGEKQTGLMMSDDGRIKYVIGELEDGTYANGIGGIEKIWDKGPDPAWKMNTIPFVIMSTGISMNMHQSLINKLKGYSHSRPYGSLFFVSSKKHIEIYQKYLHRVIELFEGKNSTMYKTFKDIGNNVTKAYNFWNEFGEKLYPVINMNDGFVISKMNEEGNESLKDYYSILSELYNSHDFSPKTDDIIGGYYNIEGSPIVQTGALIDKYIIPKDRGYLDEVGRKVLDSVIKYIIGVINNPRIEENDKKRVFKEAYERLERHIYSKMIAYKQQTDNKQVGNKWYGNYDMYTRINKVGLEIFDEKPENPANEESVRNFRKRPGGYEDFLEEQYQRLKNRSNQNNDILTEKKHTRDSVRSILDIVK